jgi:hypothetical protein
MRRLVCLGLLGAFAVATLGCAQMSKEVLVGNQILIDTISTDGTVTESYTEHMHRLTAVVDQDAKALMEDWDLLWQRDRISRLSRWYER